MVKISGNKIRPAEYKYKQVWGYYMSGQLLNGRYQIVQVLGGGAFGQTFLAKDINRPGHPSCVVKQLRYFSNNPEDLKIARLLFKREAEILEKLGKHDQIPTLLAELEENQEFYLVQELIVGHTLFQEVLPDQPWSEYQVINLLKEVLDILLFVHAQRVIHRDIKPANLMRRSSDGKIVLIDFGAVKEIGTPPGGGQSTPTIIGTLGYMPDEQLRGQPQFNSDIYALGMLAIQALLGLRANELTKLRDPVNPNNNEVIWRNRGQVSAGLANLIDKMVRPSYLQRYQLASEVLADLEKISQIPVQSGKKIQMPPFRNRGRVIVAGLAALILLVGLPRVFPKNPQSSNAQELVNLGLEKVVKGDNNGAIANFTRAIEIDPNYANAYYNRGNAYYNLNEYKAALEDYNQAIRLNPNNADFYYYRGSTRHQLKEYNAAIEDYNQAIRLNPDYSDAYNNRGNTRYNLEDYKAAIEDYNQAIRLNPNNALFYNNRGITRDNLKEYNAAIEDYNQAIRLNPDYSDAYNNRGNTRYSLEDYKAAIEDYNQAISLSPKNAIFYSNRGNTRYNLGEYKAAIEDYNQAIRIDPNYAYAYYKRGDARDELKDYKAAIEDYNQAIRLNPNNADFYCYRGITRYNLKEYKAAIEDYNQAIRLNPDYAFAYYKRGDARDELKEYKAAIEDYNQAIRLNPNNADFYKYRAITRSNLKQYKAAIEDYNQVIRLNPNYANAYYNRGLAHANIGDKQEAIADYRKAADLYQQQGKTKDYQDALDAIKKL